MAKKVSNKSEKAAIRSCDLHGDFGQQAFGTPRDHLPKLGLAEKVKKMKEEFNIKAASEGHRIDTWLAQKTGRSRRIIKQLLDNGRVTVNGKKVRIASWALRVNDRVTVMPELPTKKTRIKGFLKVHYEDRDIMVVEKPWGVHTVAGKDQKHLSQTLTDQVRAYLQRKYAESGGVFVEPLHRLDVETSGLVLFARSKKGQLIKEQFAKHSVKRRYYAIVEGRVEKESGILRFDLEKGDFSHGRKVKVVPSGEGIEAKTEYRVMERYENATLLDLNLYTGKTHQIRVHFAHIGHPVMGDKLYGSTSQLHRHALHAYILGFRSSGEKMEFRSPLPADLEKVVNKLRGIDEE